MIIEMEWSTCESLNDCKQLQGWEWRGSYKYVKLYMIINKGWKLVH